ncbi:hypothetical protein jhhlp_007007 [Lomentospora prolificans]|uniref:Peptidase A2 domain-containing protein n=1 Tax=Lomentospora prolificans TaxID=41688 RepID=A0A2N3N1H1_9PEZI|nr:hypothetical protein jhhlp_007007 [Lomentospora prolificans]
MADSPEPASDVLVSTAVPEVATNADGSEIASGQDGPVSEPAPLAVPDVASAEGGNTDAQKASEDPTSPTSPISPVSPTGNSQEPAVEWTALDKELLDAATDDPAKIPDLLEQGANVAVRSSSGRPLLITLFKHALAKKSMDTVLQVLPGILDKMSPEHIDAKGSKQMTAVIYIVYEDPPFELLAPREDIVKLLIQHGADLNTKDTDGCTALDWASRRGYTRIAELLLDNGADPNVVDNANWTPLQTASRYGHDEIAKLLLDRRVRVDVPDNTGWTPLKMAARYGYDNIVEMLLKEDVEVDYLDNDGWTALEEAVYGGHENIVKILLEHGADPNKADKDGCTLLNGSSRSGNANIVRLLLSKDANVNQAEKDGWTPLMAACRNNHKDVAVMLIAKGADIDRADNDGWPPIEVAARYGHTDIVKLLLDHGAQVNLTDNEGWTTLEVAARYGFDEIVRALLLKGANPNTKDDKGWTPLVLASKWGCEAVVEMLLNAGADIHAANGSGLTSIHSASYNNHKGIVELLINRGANISRGDNDGETPLHLASRQGNAVIVELLIKHLRAKGVNALDGDSETALHVTARCKEEHVDLLANDSARDEEADRFCEAKTGDEASGQFLRVIQLLLEHGADPTILTPRGQTALHMAAGINDGERTKAILSRMNKATATIRNAEGKTAMWIAADRKIPESLRQLLLGLKATDWGIHNIEKETLEWAAESEATHDIVAMILLYSKRLLIGQIPVDPSWDAVTLAAYYGEYGLLWKILQSAAPHPGDNKRRKMVESLVRRVIKIIDADTSQMKRNVEERRGSIHHPKGLDAGSTADKADAATVRSVRRSLDGEKDDPDLKKVDSEGNKVESKMKGGQPARQKANLTRPREDYDQILDILLDPPIVKTSVARVPYAKPETKIKFPRFDACVIDFYARDGRSGFLRRFRDVKEVVYNDGPKEIMNKARKAMQSSGETYVESDLTFRWIHLPANNLQWMNDLALRIFIDDGESQEAYEELRTLLRGSWHEVPDSTFESRFMKPSCSTRLGAKWKGKPKSQSHPAAVAPAADKQANDAGSSTSLTDTTGSSSSDPSKGEEKNAKEVEKADADKSKQSHDSKSQIALYMPYITFSTQRNNATARDEYHQLLKSYEDANLVIHGSRTLDEFYYHFESDYKSEKERRRRNKDQVVTAELNAGIDVGKSDSWTILRVDQLWLWVLNDKYIVTSSTHRVDDADDIIPSTILNYLSKDPGSERARPQPDSAVAMSKFIVDFCVGFFSHLQADAGPMVKKPEGRRSTRQIFSDAINRASLKEAELFRKFTERSGKNIQDVKRLKSVREAADLLRNVKDIRDELNILRVIVSYQKMVQELLPMPAGIAHNDRHARSIVGDIEELDKVAKKIEGAVNATLSLEQSAIAIAQSDESVQQGRTLMAFTIITILFQREEDGDLSYTPEWIFPKLFGLSFAVWVPTLVWAFYSGKVIEFFSNFRQRLGVSAKVKKNTMSAETKDDAAEGMKEKAKTGPVTTVHKGGLRRRAARWAGVRRTSMDEEAGEASGSDAGPVVDKNGSKVDVADR